MENNNANKNNKMVKIIKVLVIISFILLFFPSFLVSCSDPESPDYQETINITGKETPTSFNFSLCGNLIFPAKTFIDELNQQETFSDKVEEIKGTILFEDTNVMKITLIFPVVIMILLCISKINVLIRMVATILISLGNIAFNIYINNHLRDTIFEGLYVKALPCYYLEQVVLASIIVLSIIVAVKSVRQKISITTE